MDLAAVCRKVQPTNQLTNVDAILKKTAILFINPLSVHGFLNYEMPIKKELINIYS